MHYPSLYRVGNKTFNRIQDNWTIDFSLIYNPPGIEPSQKTALFCVNNHKLMAYSLGRPLSGVGPAIEHLGHPHRYRAQFPRNRW
jgi:hypothetical protein